MRRRIISWQCITGTIFIASVLALSCSPAESPSEETAAATETSQSPFPYEDFSRAKALARDGYALYCSAMREEDQAKRDEILERALQEYYFPAQSILSSISEKFTTGEDAVRVDWESEKLSRKIDDVVKSKGVPRGD